MLTAAWFDLEAMELSWAGVGNVEARLVRGAAVYGDRHDSALVLGGVVGYNLPPVRPARTDLRPGDAVAFATDGIEADYSGSLTPGLPAQRLAERILSRHGARHGRRPCGGRPLSGTLTRRAPTRQIARATGCEDHPLGDPPA